LQSLGEVFALSSALPGRLAAVRRPGAVVGAVGLELAALHLGWGRGHPFRATTRLGQHSLLLPLVRPGARRDTPPLHEEQTTRSVKRSLQDGLFKGKGKHRI